MTQTNPGRVTQTNPGRVNRQSPNVVKLKQASKPRKGDHGEEVVYQNPLMFPTFMYLYGAQLATPQQFAEQGITPEIIGQIEDHLERALGRDIPNEPEDRISPEMSAAIAEFQGLMGLERTGAIDAQTLAALAEVNGFPVTDAQLAGLPPPGAEATQGGDNGGSNVLLWGVGAAVAAGVGAGTVIAVRRRQD